MIEILLLFVEGTNRNTHTHTHKHSYKDYTFIFCISEQKLKMVKVVSFGGAKGEINLQPSPFTLIYVWGEFVILFHNSLKLILSIWRKERKSYGFHRWRTICALSQLNDLVIITNSFIVKFFLPTKIYLKTTLGQCYKHLHENSWLGCQFYLTDPMPIPGIVSHRTRHGKKCASFTRVLKKFLLNFQSIGPLGRCFL